MNRENLKLATLGGGCFWCIEVLFQELEGVEEVLSGYSGGTINNPSYREVCSGLTGHAEVIQLLFDPEVISYEDLLRVFFTSHDPTTLNKQGGDVGTQYRSVVFYHDEEQNVAAQKILKELAPSFGAEMVTEVTEFSRFFKAEESHQNYYNENQNQPYCSAVISPKLKKLRMLHVEKLKKKVV